VLKHEHFEELCAAAAIGQASPEELAQLELHAAECGLCESRYAAYVRVAAQQFAAADRSPVLSPQEADQCLNSELLTHRFFERAEKEGILFSDEVEQEVRHLPPVSFSRRWLWWPKLRMATAAMVVVAGLLSADYVLRKDFRNRISSILPAKHEVPEPPRSAPQGDVQVTVLAADNLRRQTEVDRLSNDLRRVNDQLALRGTNLKVASEELRELLADREALELHLKDAQSKLAESQAAIASAQQEIARLRDHAAQTDVALVTDQTKIRDLTDELSEKTAALEKEHQLLGLGHDVSDLMGARNLHIVDVVDTDARGKTRPAFGRVFFTEGKSLVFYAFDLNEAKIQKANYWVWAKQEGGSKQVRSLGIFYSDDKAQKRWVFKCNDPKVLSEIDSVFVTLEPAGSEPSHPKGSNLMYAYLRAQPNHP
jgi:cell division septum initiation protein DivIVA